MADVTVLGLGMRSPAQLTREAEAALRGATEVLYLDAGLATPRWLATLCPRPTPLFATTYAEGAPRLTGYRDMAVRVLEAAMAHPPVVFATQGHPLVGITASRLIAAAAPRLGLTVELMPGISALDGILCALGLDPVVEGLQMFEATDLLLRERPMQADMPVLLWQAGTVESCLYTARPALPQRFARLVAHLARFYPEDHPVTAVHLSDHPLVEDAVWTVPLAGLAGEAERLHAGVTLYLPAVGRRAITDTELLGLVARPEHLARITR